MLQNGANINSQRINGHTPLHTIVYLGNSSFTKLKENRIIHSDPTTLFIGIERNVDLLIRKGADINAVDYAGDTPLHVAAERGKDSWDNSRID